MAEFRVTLTDPEETVTLPSEQWDNIEATLLFHGSGTAVLLCEARRSEQSRPQSRVERLENIGPDELQVGDNVGGSIVVELAPPFHGRRLIKWDHNETAYAYNDYDRFTVERTVPAPTSPPSAWRGDDFVEFPAPTTVEKEACKLDVGDVVVDDDGSRYTVFFVSLLPGWVYFHGEGNDRSRSYARTDKVRVLVEGGEQ